MLWEHSWLGGETLSHHPALQVLRCAEEKSNDVNGVHVEL